MTVVRLSFDMFTFVWMSGWMDRWMGGWMDVRMGGWMDGWVDWWMGGCARLRAIGSKEWEDGK